MGSVVTMKNTNVLSEGEKSVVNILDNVLTKGEVKGSALPKSVGVDLIIEMYRVSAVDMDMISDIIVGDEPFL